MLYLGNLELEFEKKAIVIFKTSTPKFAAINVFSHKMNFCIRSTISESQGPGLLYKVCLLVLWLLCKESV